MLIIIYVNYQLLNMHLNNNLLIHFVYKNIITDVVDYYF